METEENGRKERGETCNLCGYSAKTFEPMTYYCNGAQCNGKRIGRGRYFYHAAGSNQWHWCSVSSIPCFFFFSVVREVYAYSVREACCCCCFDVSTRGDLFPSFVRAALMFRCDACFVFLRLSRASLSRAGLLCLLVWPGFLPFSLVGSMCVFSDPVALRLFGSDVVRPSR